MATVTVNKDDAGNIAVRFRYDLALIAKVKTIPGYRWNQEGKCWSFPHSEHTLNEIHTAFAGQKLDIDPSLQALKPKSEAAEPASNSLLDRMRHMIRMKHYSIRTEQAYLSWVQRYLLFHDNRDPKEMGRAEIEAFLSHLALKGKVSSSTQNQAFNALLFLYREVLKKDLDESINAIRAKKPVRLPTVMTKDETMRVISAVRADRQLAVRLIYGAGLRLMECVRLRVKDIDFGGKPHPGSGCKGHEGPHYGAARQPKT